MKKHSLINVRADALVLGSLLTFEGLLMSICAAVSFFYEDEDKYVMLFSGVFTLLIGVFCLLKRRRINKVEPQSLRLNKRDGFIVVSLVWIVFSFFGSIPLYIDDATSCYTDAFFETMSAFTTTGGTILRDVESLPFGLSMWRCMMQWIGGMGIIVLSLAVLPFFGIAGVQLYRAEVPGITKDKLSPRVIETARILFGTYLLITLSEVAAYHYFGMDWFDAVCHSLTTISGGGFSTKNLGLKHWDSAYIEWTAVFYMFLAGVNFFVTYYALKWNFKEVRNNEELHLYFVSMLIGVAIMTLGRYVSEPINFTLEAFHETVRTNAFEATSIISGTGFVLTDINNWHPFICAMLMLAMITGACGGSACGGLKLVRVWLLLKNTYLEFKRMLHPAAVIPVKLNKKSVDSALITNILAFLVLYVGICIVSVMVFMLFGYDFYSATGVSITCLSDCGPGFGEFASGSYCDVPSVLKWYMCLLMLMGRLELFTFLFVLMPSFWKRY